MSQSFDVATIVIISALSLLALTTAASAAALGGNCCADLEERIAELEATTASGTWILRFQLPVGGE